jgi:predicted nucleic acid-binding protein
VIVVDTNVIAYLHLPGDYTAAAREALRLDPDWSAPLLWRSEFRSVLFSYIRGEGLSTDDAVRLARMAESLLAGREHILDTAAVLSLASGVRCSAYDCEFVALAQALDVPLVTTDAVILQEFSDRAVGLEEFAGKNQKS